VDGDPDVERRSDARSYDRWVRGAELLQQRNPEAAATVFAALHLEEPASRAVLEALARALFDARRFDAAADAFSDLVAIAPDDDYALFGLGLSLWRLQRFREAADPLAMAVVMRPDRADYANALAQVRATLRARQAAGLPTGIGDATPSGGVQRPGPDDDEGPR
jgi:Flp pilus assembly protein TadD